MRDTPARRADYFTVTGSDQYPLFVCATRWVEDIKPAARLLSVWPNMQKLFHFWLSLPKMQQPSGKSFETVRLAIEDPLMTYKLSFFSYVASLLEPFLTKYQTNCPIVPYLYTDLTALFRSLMKIIVRDEVLEQCSIGYKLLQINICENNLKSSKDFSIGFVAEGALRNLTKKALLPKKAKKMSFIKVLSNVSQLRLTN